MSTPPRTTRPGDGNRQTDPEHAHKPRTRVARDDRSIPAVMNDWTRRPNRRRARIAREYWDAYESGQPMSADDY